MAGAKTNRLSTYTSASAGSGISGAAADTKKDLWSSLLDSVASGRRLPEKNIVLLGGSVESQRELVQSLAAPLSDPRRRGRDNSTPPVANSFALGYTYYDVLDTDQEDTLARVSLYTLTTPAPAFGPLLGPLLTPQSIPDTVMVILLDWAEPWRWLRQLREWILLLRTVLVGLSDECKETMAEVMTAWRDRGRGGGTNLDGTTLTAPSGEDAGAALPLGPGEWDDALGLPLCLVCQNVGVPKPLRRVRSPGTDFA